MKMKSSDFTVGAFVLGGMVAIIAMFVIVRGQLNKQDSYHSYFNNVSGLRAGASVIYEGYIIGTVSDITPEQTQTGMTFRVDFGVEEGWAIPSDSFAEIAALSLLSAQSIQIIAGTDTPLSPGDKLRSRPATNLMADLGRTADQFAQIADKSLVPLLATVDSLLNDEARNALTGITSLSQSVNDGVPAILESVGRTAGNIETASESVKDIAGDATQRAVNEALDNVVSATKTANDASQSMLQTTQEAGALVEEISDTAKTAWLGEVSTMLDRLSAATQSVETMSQSALAAAQNVEGMTGEETRTKIMSLLDDVKRIRANLEIASESVMTATDNVANLSDISEDRIDAFLQKLESAALNVEEMTARLRDDPSIIIRGSN